MSAHAEDGGTSIEPDTIFVVDDSRDTLQLLTRTLTAAGYRVRPADTAEAALASLDTDPPALILLEFSLPDMDGFQVLRQLKSRDGSRDIPVIFLSAATETAKRVEVLKSGAVDFISKPFQTDELLARVKTHIELGALRARLRRQAADLTAANDQFHLLFEHMPSGFALHEIIKDESGTALDYRFLQVNPAFEQLTGLKADDLIGRTVLEVMPQTEAVWIDRYGQVATTGGPITFENYAQELGRHYQVVAYRPRPEQFAVIFQDATERVEIEQALRKAEANMAKAQAVAKLGSWEHDLTTGATIWSAEMARLTGMAAAAEWPSFSDYLRIVHPEDRETAMRANTQAADTGEPAAFEFRSNPDGETVRYFQAAVEPLCDQTGRVTRLMGTLQDITERREAEEHQRMIEKKILQTQKLESLGVMAGGIAHDFNNILMAVLGHAELALDEILPGSPARENLSEITTAARYASELCRQMLAYSGRESFALERVNVSEMIEEMTHLLKTSISNKAILNLHLEQNLPSVLADPSHLRQVVMNLIINASEAVGERSGAITVTSGAARCTDEYLRTTELQNELEPGLYVCVEVADTGSGMDVETKERIFEPFFTTKFTGRGLGLAAVLGIVRAHKGALKVYSELGKGTTFKVLFPAEDIPENGTTTETGSALSTWRGSGTILLADDEESLRALAGLPEFVGI